MRGRGLRMCVCVRERECVCVVCLRSCAHADDECVRAWSVGVRHSPERARGPGPQVDKSTKSASGLGTPRVAGIPPPIADHPPAQAGPEEGELLRRTPAGRIYPSPRPFLPKHKESIKYPSARIPNVVIPVNVIRGFAARFVVRSNPAQHA